MRTLRNSVAGVVLGVALTVSWFVGNSLVRNVEFARAQERVDASRAQIANVQDMAAVFKSVGKAVEPSVVNIEVTKTINRSDFLRNRLRNNAPDDNGNNNNNNNDNNGDIPDNILPFFNMPQQFHEVGTGSGVIMETDGKTGYIVTNNHVASNASEMTITLSDGREIKNAKVLGTDPKSDLAVIKVEEDHLIPAKWGDSSSLEKGDIILAFGSPFGYVGSMTHGIISALNREQVGIIPSRIAYEDFIQVDAPINPGNSGGPLVNLKGEVVGINTAIASESGGFQGIGFAIPSNQAKSVYEAIKTKGKVVRGWLGVGIADVSKAPDQAQQLGYTDTSGVLVPKIYRDTPAYGKLQPNDIVTAINGKKVQNSDQLRNTIASLPPDSDVKLSVFRDKKDQDVTIKLGEQPEDIGAIASAEAGRPGRNNQSSAGSIGVQLATSTPDLAQRYGLDNNVKGAVITGVSPNSPADRGGLQRGDVITKIGGTPVNTAEEASDVLSKQNLGAGITLYVTDREGMRSVFIKSTQPQPQPQAQPQQ